jgi:hypothetical protein
VDREPSAKRFGAAVVDDACAAALDIGVHDYRFVRRYLERRPQLPLTLHQVDPLIRELAQYRDLIHQRTKAHSSPQCVACNFKDDKPTNYYNT